MRRIPVRFTAALALLLAALSTTVPVPAQAPGPGVGEAVEKGRQWALLIGVEKYQKARPLDFTINDVKILSKTLRERNGLDDDAVLEITDDAESPRLRPTRANLLEEVPRWLARIGPQDRLIVYFSGHGLPDPAGKLYLAPIDFDRADPASTGLPVEWFRQQIADCKAAFKLLVLDACHSGSEKGAEGARDVPSKDIVEPFRKLAGVVTLASSTDEEGSHIWDEKEQSLYSYWLNQGLKGHADSNADGAVDIDELNDYVYRNVVWTAQAHFPRRQPQTPVRIVRSGVKGSPVVVRVKPNDLKTLLSDMAEQLTLAAEDHKLKKVGVLEFSGDHGLVELLGANFGTLGRFCADWLERRLMEQGKGAFSVTDGKALQAALVKDKFGLDDLANPERLKQLSQSIQGLPALAQGTFRARVGRVITLQCRLLQTESDELAGSAGGVALLSESEWAMLGKSVALSPADRVLVPSSLDDGPPKDLQDRAIAKMDELSKGPHPMTNPNFEFPVRIYVGGKERPGYGQGNKWFVPLHQGETYEIHVENRSGQPVCMRLLVDGLNTLPDLEMAKTKGVATFVWGQHVSLEDARHYVLNPAKHHGTRKIWHVSGFITETGENGKLREFVVGSAEQSLAAQRKFTDQMGLITAAFYDSVAKSRGVGTIAGPERPENLPEDADYTPGNLRAVVNIYYVDPDEAVPSQALPHAQPGPARR